MPKTTCSCDDDSKKEYTNSAPKYFTYNHFDNNFVVSFQNPARILRDMVKNGAPSSLVDRANCLSCDDSVSSQDKLKVRKKDRPTPYRVPYNHYRKVTSCITDDCLSNVKINKDISCNQIIDCIPTNYAISRQVDKNGVRNINNGGNYKNYLQSSAKSYKLNTFGILPENLLQGTEHTYKIGSVEDTVYNKNSGSIVTNNCLLGYSFTTSQNDKSISYKNKTTTTKKYSNPTHRISGSVSSKAHLQKKKYRAILSGQSKGKDGYNNCRNGEPCTLYMSPGPNTKLFMGKTAKQTCNPSRIRGMKQRCPAPSLIPAPVIPAPVTPVNNPCDGRNGSFTNSSMVLGGMNDPQPPYSSVIPTSNMSHFVVQFTFTLTNDDLISGDILQIAITTNYGSFFSGFFTSDHQNHIWTKNQRPTISPYPTSPSIWIQQGSPTSNPVGNIISGAIQSVVVENSSMNTSSNIYTQILNVTIGTNISSSPGTITLGIYGNNTWLTTHPNGDYNVDYQISCNCWTSTDLLDGYDYEVPPALSNLSLLPSNFHGGNRNGLNPGGIGYTDVLKNPCMPWEDPLPSKYGYDAIVDYSFNVLLKFTLEDDISSGDTIKLTMKRPPDSGEFNNGPIFYPDDAWPLNSPPSTGNYGNYIELKSGSTVKTLASVSLGTYNTTTGLQEITLTIGENISASNITINFFNQGYNNWSNNAKDGTALTFDLEVDGHTTSTGNLGWYAQDITTQDTNGTTTLSTTALFKSGNPQNNPETTITYRHYSEIPQNSKIRLIFRTQFVVGTNIDYTIFNASGGNFTGAADIVNNSSPTVDECGIWINSKDLNNANTNNDIAIGSFALGGLKEANYVATNESGGYPDTNYGSIEYLEFTINESGGIPGDTPSPNNTTSDGGKYIEININMRKAITNNYLPSYASGKIHFSIQVFDPNDVLIGGAYSLEGAVDGVFTI